MLEADKYSEDPRKEITVELLEGDSEWAGALPPGSVNSDLSSVSRLQAVVDAATAADSVVVVKFERKDCKACDATKGLFSDAAEELGDDGLFFSVSFDEHKQFCQQSKVRAVPSTHIYGRDGTLQHVGGLGEKAWPDFRKKLESLVRA